MVSNNKIDITGGKFCCLMHFLLAVFFSNWLLGVGYYYASRNNCRMDLYFHAAIKDLGTRTAAALARANITHWADGGTLLGGAREHDLIAHDSDVDIAVWTWDKERIHEALARAGLGVHWTRLEGLNLMRVFDRDFPLDTRFPHVDINEWTIDKEDPKLMHDIQKKTDSEKKKYHVAWLGPNRRPSKHCFVNLGKFHVPTPCEKERWLEHQFGSNWMKKAVPRWQDCKNSITSRIWGYKL